MPRLSLGGVGMLTRLSDVAVVTGLYFALYNLGGALGNVISGSVWNQKMPQELMARLDNQTLAMEVYASPYAAIIPYPVGTPERADMTAAYSAVQKILAIIGICVCLPLIVFALCLRDTHLTNEQSRKDAEEDEEDVKDQPETLSFWQRLWR